MSHGVQFCTDTNSRECFDRCSGLEEEKPVGVPISCSGTRGAKRRISLRAFSTQCEILPSFHSGPPSALLKITARRSFPRRRESSCSGHGPPPARG